MRRLAIFFSLFLLLGETHLLRAVPLTPVCAIQGSGYSSPYNGQTVRTRGVVFADLDQTAQKGFFLQESACDSSSSTSDGLFVYLGERIDVVQPGDRVEVNGVVSEYYGMTELQAAASAVSILAHNQPLPASTPLSPPFPASAARFYFETLESMYVRLDDGRVVGPTDSDDRTWLVETSLGLEHVPYNYPPGLGGIICADDGGLYEITPEAAVGQRIPGLAGALDFRMGVYCLELTAAPLGLPVANRPTPVAATPHSAGALEIASFNLADLFDNLDDPAVDDDVISGPEYQRRLQKRALALRDALGLPDVVAIQEAENRAVLDALVARPEVSAPYQIIHVDGPDARGLDVGLLVRTDRAVVLSYQVRQGCTALVDGLEPDGNGDLENPANTPTCDRNGDGQLDGNRLFSRPPLVVSLQADLSSGPLRFWLIVNHLKSRLEDTSSTTYTLPRRQQQAEFVAALAQELRRADPAANLVVLGDLNDTPESAPLQALTAAGLVNLLTGLPSTGQYTYIYRGISQPLDHILVSLPPNLLLASFQSVHINADYPYAYTSQASTLLRSSDHDPLLASFTPASRQIYFPLVYR